jgi:hypothetical protein
MNEVPPKFFFFFSFLFFARSQFNWPSLINYLTMKAPQNKRFYFEVYVFFPLARTYYRRKEDNNCQNIWDKSEVLWRTSREHIGNLMRTHWELEWKNIWNTLGTREKWKKIKSFPLQLKRKKKNKAPWVHAWAFPLVAWNFLSQKKSWSPFLAWVN